MGSPEFYQLLAKVSSTKQINQAARRILKSLHHGLAIVELAFGEVAAERLERFAVAILPVEHDHPLDAQAVHQDGAPIANPIRLGRVVVRERAAHDDAAEEVEPREQEIEDLAADVV